MSNTLVKEIVNVFVNEIIINSKSFDGNYKIYKLDIFEIKFPNNWQEKKYDASKDEKNINYNLIKISVNNYNIGLADYQKEQTAVQNQIIDLIFEEIKNNVMMVGGRKKKIQVKNTKHSKIITGPRGGKYMLLPNGKKQYLSK